MKINCRYREHGDGKVSLDQDDVVAIMRNLSESHPESFGREVFSELADAFASVRKLVPLKEALREVV